MLRDPDEETLVDLCVVAGRASRDLLGDERSAAVTTEAVARTVARWNKAAESPRAFATRAAIRLALDDLEGDARRQGRSQAPEGRSRAGGDPPAAARARELVARSLAQGRRHREVLVARYALGYSAVEVSRILGISLPTVKLELGCTAGVENGRTPAP